jgi:4-hydroxy-2-oxoheptanedioate aldolase
VIRELEKARELRRRLLGGEVALGAQLALYDPTVIEIFGRAGFDWLVIDTEHAAHSPLTVKAMLQTGVHSDAVVLARPLRLDPDEIRRYLDLGSPGVLCPFVETGEQAQLLVDACRYPPAGFRGHGPRRAAVYGFDAVEYFEVANEAMLCIPIIESEKAVANIGDIAAVDGIDGVTLGPMDLSLDLGVFRQFEHERYLEAVEEVRAACKRHGKAMGTGCYSIDHAAACRDAGDTLLLVGGDDLALQQTAAATIAALS